VKGGGGTSGATACASATAVRSFFGAIGFATTALRFAAFPPADFNFRVRMAFFVVALCLVDMDIPPVTVSQ